MKSIKKDQQLGLFDDAENRSIPLATPKKSICNIYIDGAARNNPGPAGAGVYIMMNETVVLQQGYFLGSMTNNKAEYYALLIALILVREFIIDPAYTQVVIHSDSQLLIRQMTQLYKVKDQTLLLMYQAALQLQKTYKIEYVHVYREHNKQADFYANQGIDTKNPVPAECLAVLQKYTL